MASRPERHQTTRANRRLPGALDNRLRDDPRLERPCRLVRTSSRSDEDRRDPGSGPGGRAGRAAALTPADFEKLGVFYLGRPYDLATKQASAALLYDSKDLVTHAVCVGMTGSGKTGLCLGLIEEALLDGIPVLIIDPKGDLPNLCLTFPDLRPEDFAPWVNEDDARRKGVTRDVYASQQAELWRKGLLAWGQDGARIRRLRDAADVIVYTPGSTAGLPVSIVKSFAAPARAVRDDASCPRADRTTATSLLGLLGIEADPLRSREHILLAKLLEAAWQGRISTCRRSSSRSRIRPLPRWAPRPRRVLLPEGAVRAGDAAQQPSRRPGFRRLARGRGARRGALLHTPEGKPRAAIFSIAHLSDAERMFFVSPC